MAREECKGQSIEHTRNILESKLILHDVTRLSRSTIYMDKVIPCRLVNIDSVVSTAINLVDNSLGEDLVYKRVSRKGLSVHMVSYCGAKARYSAITQHSAVLVEALGRRWLLLFYCSDPASFREYKRLLGFEEGNISEKLAGFPISDALTSLKANVLIFYAPWAVLRDARIIFDLKENDFGSVVSEEAIGSEVLVAASRSSYSLAWSPNGYLAIQVRPAIASMNKAFFSKLLAALLGITIDEDNSFILSRTMLEAVASSFQEAVERDKPVLEFVRGLVRYTHSRGGS